MKRMQIVLCAVVLLAGGCTTYYKVTDPTTNKTYYTTELKQDHGTATLKDARTGNMVTIQNSEVSQVSKEQFESGKVEPVKPDSASGMK